MKNHVIKNKKIIRKIVKTACPTVDKSRNFHLDAALSKAIFYREISHFPVYSNESQTPMKLTRDFQVYHLSFIEPL
jgi:hypothetical protein